MHGTFICGNVGPMAESTPESWQTLFLAGAAAFVLYQMIRGWQLGVVRVVAKILAVVAAYVCAWIGGPKIAPILRPLSMPDPVLVALGGALIGILVFVILSLASAVLFKKTSDQSVGLVRFGYGATGALAGMCVGVFLVWLGMLGIKLLGTLAAPGATAHARTEVVQVSDRGIPVPAPQEPGAVVRGLAQMKRSLEQGPAGAVMEQIDPIPGTVYTTIGKVGQMTASQESAKRFAEYPGVAPLMTHPKMLALRDDPEIARAALSNNFLALMRNPRVVSLANDPEIIGLLQKLEFQKALDYAVSTPDNRPVPQRNKL